MDSSLQTWDVGTFRSGPRGQWATSWSLESNDLSNLLLCWDFPTLSFPTLPFLPAIASFFPSSYWGKCWKVPKSRREPATPGGGHWHEVDQRRPKERSVRREGWPTSSMLSALHWVWSLGSVQIWFFFAVIGKVRFCKWHRLWREIPEPALSKIVKIVVQNDTYL